MPRLLFKREFFKAIREGRKTTTLRRWMTCSLVPGERLVSPGLGWLRIIRCERIELGQLQEADARADGFASLTELRDTLGRLYPNHGRDGKQWYRITFALDGAAPGAAAATAVAAVAASGHAGAAAPPPELEPRAMAKDAKTRLARRIQAELDKAVRRSGSFSP